MSVKEDSSVSGISIVITEPNSLRDAAEFERSKSEQPQALLPEVVVDHGPDAQGVGPEVLSAPLIGRNESRQFLRQVSTSSSRLFASMPNLSNSNLLVMEEIGPEGSVIFDVATGSSSRVNWKPSFSKFHLARENRPNKDNLPKSVRRYYKKQDEMIRELQALEHQVASHDGRNGGLHDPADAEEYTCCGCGAERLAQITFAVNFVLMIAKGVASGLSGSLSIISSLLDSVVDLLSGAIIWWSERNMKKRDIYNYPTGKTRLGPVALIILASVMAIASLQPIIEAVKQLVTGSSDPDVTLPAIVLMACTIGIKLTLFLVSCRSPDPGVQALAQDHRNDIISNSGALLFGFLGSYGSKNWGDKRWAYFDPAGAILISIYIIISWFLTGREQVKVATGRAANPQFLQKLTWICVNHHAQVLQIDTVRAFHFGVNYLVEVDIVLAEDLPLRKAHDIGEALQVKLERLTEVERAFVHLDYESTHHPDSEHKIL